MKQWFIGALAGLALLLPGLTAQAQLARPEHPIAVRVGALWPTDDAVQAATSDTWINIGLDYVFGRTADGHDWMGAVDFATQDNVNYWAFQGIYKWHNTGSGSGAENFSFGVGLGVYLLDPDNGDNQTEWGIPLVADWYFTERLFLEGKYHWVVSDNAATGLSLQLGYTF